MGQMSEQQFIGGSVEVATHRPQRWMDGNIVLLEPLTISKTFPI